MAALFMAYLLNPLQQLTNLQICMPRKILLIDNDAVKLNLLSQLLSCKGYDVSTLQRTDRIFFEIAKSQPDVILLSEMLTDVNSHTVERSIQAVDSSRQIPLIKLSQKDYSGFTALMTNHEGTPGFNGLDNLIHRIELQWVA
jgi:PleD family two-component response regulator